MRASTSLALGLAALLAGTIAAAAGDGDAKGPRGKPEGGYVTTWQPYYVYRPYPHRPVPSFELFTGPDWRKRPAGLAEARCAELLDHARVTRSDHWWKVYKREC